MINQKYINKIFPVNIKKEDISELISLSLKVNGIITIVQGSLVVSAKSIVDLLNIDYSKPMELLIQAYLIEEHFNQFKKWEIH